MEKLYTYEEIREQALNDNVDDNKVSIGIWARLMGYYKIRKQINNIQNTYYFKK